MRLTAILLGGAFWLGSGVAGAEGSHNTKGADRSPPIARSAPESAGGGTDHLGHPERASRSEDTTRLVSEADSERTVGFVFTAVGVVGVSVGAAMIALGAPHPSPTGPTADLQPAGAVAVGVGGLSLLIGIPMLIQGMIDTHALSAQPPPPALPAAILVGPHGASLRWVF